MGRCFDFNSYLEAVGKSVEEICDYAEAFWQNHHRIENGHKYVERIEKGEQDIERRRLVDLSIKLKFDSLLKAFKESNQDIDQFTLRHITIDESEDPPVGDLLAFTPAEDRIMTLGLFKYGYGAWTMIRNDIRNSRELAFNLISKSRSVADVQKRCDWLITGFKRQF